MKDFKEDMKYGFRLYPYAVMIMTGLFVSSTGPVLLRGVLSGLRNSALFTPLRLVNILGFQLAGGIIAVAGLFGALHRVLKDTR